MSEAPEQGEVVPQAGADFDVDKTDPWIRFLDRAIRSRDRWRRAALAGLGLAVFLFILSVVQFLGTLTACKLLEEARRESTDVNRATTDTVREIREAQQRIEAASAQAHEDVLAINRAKVDKDWLDRNAAAMETQIRQLDEQMEIRRLLLKDMENRWRIVEREWNEFLKKLPADRNDIPPGLKAFLPRPPGHGPDKHCPSGIKRVVGDDDDN